MPYINDTDSFVIGVLITIIFMLVITFMYPNLTSAKETTFNVFGASASSEKVANAVAQAKTAEKLKHDFAHETVPRLGGFAAE